MDFIVGSVAGASLGQAPNGGTARYHQKLHGLAPAAARSAMIAATMLLMGGSAWAAPACRYGSWAEEVQEIEVNGWQIIELTDVERDTIIALHRRRTHEKIDAAHAWEERRRHFDASGIVEYSIVFTNAAGCIQYQLNFANAAELQRKLEPVLDVPCARPASHRIRTFPNCNPKINRTDDAQGGMLAHDADIILHQRAYH
jgi:hypothetical protein